MKQKPTTYILSIFCLSLFVSSSGLAATRLVEDFNSSWSTQSPPPGWTIYYNTPVGNSDWHRRQAQTPWTDNQTGYACLYQTPQELGDDILTSPIVNCSLYTNVVLRCSTYFIPQEGFYVAKLQGSSDGGANWIDIYNYYGVSVGPGLQVFDCPWANNKPEVKFRWYFSGNTNQIYHWSIDNVAVTGDPIIYDVAATGIVAPTGTIDSGAVMTPLARVKNLGNVTVSFPVVFQIGTFYTDMKVVNNVNPGESSFVYFRTDTLRNLGTHMTRCSTALVYDANTNNDLITGSVSVRLRNVGVISIDTPVGTIDSSGAIIPRATVKNFGSNTETFNVTFTINPGYIQTRTKTLNPGFSDTVHFSAWNTARGYHITRCSTFLYNDNNKSNDTLSGSVMVRVKDVGVVDILAPTGIVNLGATIVPQAVVQNYGTNTETFPVTIQIGTWTQVVNKTLLFNEIDTIDFPAWTALTTGLQMILCYTSLTDDQQPENDIQLDSVFVRMCDVGVLSIVAPKNYVLPETIIPQVWVKNHGSVPSNLFDVKLDIEPGYSDSQLVANINAGDSILISFTPWADSLGTYAMKCSTRYADDCNRNNDKKDGTVVVSYETHGPGTWTELSQIIPGSRPLKQGSCLEAIQDSMLFLIKGNKTFEFYRFNTNNDSWNKMSDVPNGVSFKAVKKGAKMAGDGERYIYFVKGANTFEFFRYDIVTDSWKDLPNVPYGTGKKVKDGAAMAYVEKFGQGYVYFLKGSKTLEFYRYEVVHDSWRRMPDAPIGMKPGFKKGTDIVYNPENELIYCLKDRTNEMFVYDVVTDSWLSKQLTNMPMVHPLYRKTKKVKDGSALCYVSPGKIFAFKGGNTPEFWLFTPIDRDTGTWSPQNLVPIYGSDGRKRRLKYGADLVAATYHSEPALLAMKGNKTDKLWLWSDTSATFLANLPVEPENNVCGITHKTIFNLQVTPNPVRNIVNITYNLPNETKAKLKLYNIIGKAVKEYELTMSKGILTLDIEKLPAGVYLLKLETDKYDLMKKIILSH